MPPDGKYYIRLAGDLKVLIGAAVGRGLKVPVVAHGSDNVWTVTRVPDDIRKCTLTLDQSGTPWFSTDSNNQIVVADAEPTQIWGIQGYGPYTIEVASDETRVWTLSNVEAGSPVTFDTITQPLPSQLWLFVPVPE